MEETCNTGLVLGIGGGNYKLQKRDPQKSPVKFHILFPPEKERKTEELELERSSSRTTEEEEDEESYNHSNARKKLRLTKEQSGLLEECFKVHSTLNPRQKQDLADQLNLRPRQVEVWFQNRRARTKLKQTEVDCEVLKKFCENLKDENRRLKEELQELRALELGSPLYFQLPAAATLSMCPSCKSVGSNEGKNPFKVAKTKFYSHMSNSSLTCSNC